MMFLSGIFYSYERIPAEWQDLFLLNPMAFLSNCLKIVKCFYGLAIDLNPVDFQMPLYPIWAQGASLGCALGTYLSG